MGSPAQKEEGVVLDCVGDNKKCIGDNENTLRPGSMAPYKQLREPHTESTSIEYECMYINVYI
jgi:hypothetical protein